MTRNLADGYLGIIIHHLRFHWMRDAGLSAKAWMDVNNNDYEAVREVMEGYAKWTGIVQHKEDPNCDVRIEPKFTIDDQVQRFLSIFSLIYFVRNPTLEAGVGPRLTAPPSGQCPWLSGEIS